LPLLANLSLDDLDHALDRGGDTITYARYLDDMVVLAADTPKGRRWADRALEQQRRDESTFVNLVGPQSRRRSFDYSEVHSTSMVPVAQKCSRSRICFCIRCSSAAPVACARKRFPSSLRPV